MPEFINGKYTKYLDGRITNTLQKAEKHRFQCYSDRREWQLIQFRIGFRNDWSRDELLLVLKNRYAMLGKLRKQNPHAPGTLLLPMMRVAYEAETKTIKFCEIEADQSAMDEGSDQPE